ncbi:hypothetical protein V8D89_009930 [Ganoderma adspersum]
MAAPTEESPLLTPSSSDPEILKHDLLYQRFSPSQKRTIVALISYGAVIPFLATGSFIPSIPEIARELDSTGAIISLAVSLSLAVAAIGSLTWATYSGTYGRRFVYLRSLPCLCIGSVGVANSHSVPTVMFWRVVQAFGASSAMSVGAGVIGDIYRLEERGYAMGLFFGASLLGPAIAPLCGGLATHYASWRYMQWALGVMGITALPETLDPEKLNKAKIEGKTVLKVLNPFTSLVLLRSPTILVLTLAGTTALLADWVLMVPLSYTVGTWVSSLIRPGPVRISSPSANSVGAPLAGYLSDRAIVWCLGATAIWGAAFCVPVSTLAAGLTMKYVPGLSGIAIMLVCLFLNGVGVDIVLTPSASYYVDILHDRSAEAMAASFACRALILAFVTAWTFPLINSIGVLATNSLFALIAWVGYGMILFTIKYGDRMRAWVDIGYTTSRDTC